MPGQLQVVWRFRRHFFWQLYTIADVSKQSQITAGTYGSAVIVPERELQSGREETKLRVQVVQGQKGRQVTAILEVDVNSAGATQVGVGVELAKVKVVDHERLGQALGTRVKETPCSRP